MAEVAKLKKDLEESKNEISMLQAEKDAVEVELDKTIDDMLVMLGQSFNQVVRQAHLLYNGPPLTGDYDNNMDVCKGRMVPVGELQALRNAAQPSPAEEAEDED